MESEANSFTFLQLSDIHLDSPQNSGVLSYSTAQCQARYADFLETFVNALTLAQNHQVDAVFIVGGLWNHLSIRSQIVTTVLEAIEQIAPIPVYITPSDTDPFTADSYYNPRYLQALGMRSWPENAVVFASDNFTTVNHPARDDVTVTGRAARKLGQDLTNYLEEPINISQRSMVNILLHHGTVDIYQGTESSDPSRVTAPFSVDELDNQRFTYAALGHCHDYMEVENADGILIGAYSGTLAGRNFEELGPRGAIHGSIQSLADGTTTLELNPIEVARNRIMYIGVDITGLDEEMIKEEILLYLEEVDVHPEDDIVALSLEGRLSRETQVDSIIEQLKNEFYHLIVVNRTRPDYLSEQRDQRTTEHKFIEKMLESIQEAEEKRRLSPTSDSLTGIPGALISGKTIEDALYYGLDALKKKKVTVRHVD